jgi:molybdenum cofactor cytidylyltransferase
LSGLGYYQLSAFADKARMPKTKDQKPKTQSVGMILAAGQSSRMGAFKPLLPFGPRTVVETCVDNLRAAGIETVVVVVSEGPNAKKIRSQLQNYAVMFAVNPDPNSEMAASIAAGIRSVPSQAQAVIINPVDHPAVPIEIIRAVLKAWSDGALLVKPVWNNRGGHPVLVDLRFRDELLNLDEHGGLKAFFNEHESVVKRVAVESNLVARDMDTWDDYRALHQEVFGVLPPEIASKRA